MSINSYIQKEISQRYFFIYSTMEQISCVVEGDNMFSEKKFRIIFLTGSSGFELGHKSW